MDGDDHGPAALAALLRGYRHDAGLTQHELATMIGRARETVARALTVWRKDGVVVTQRMRILIMNPSALRDVAEADDDL